MPAQADLLAIRKRLLLQRSAMLRHQFGTEVMQTLAPPLTAADRVVQAGRWIGQHPFWLVAPAVALLVWRPSWLKEATRPAGLLRWAGRALWLWQWWGRLQPLMMASATRMPPDEARGAAAPLKSPDAP
ncbi:MAG: hypothetical protein QM742_10600 [Aquabacterium sp.]